MSGPIQPTTGITNDLPADPPSTLTIAERVQRSAGLVNRSYVLIADTDDLHRDVVEEHTDLVCRQIDERAQDLAGRRITELLDELADLGLAWRDVAAVVGVSVPAVRKWRAGGACTGENRLRISGLVALLEWLRREQHVADVAAWLEVPLVVGVPVTRLTMLVENRRDLVVSSMVGPETSPEAVLDAFQPDWRTRHESEFEVFTAADGQRSIRAKRS